MLYSDICVAFIKQYNKPQQFYYLVTLYLNLTVNHIWARYQTVAEISQETKPSQTKTFIPP